MPPELIERCGFVLFPYVSETFVEAVTRTIREEALHQVRMGTPHSARDLVLDLADSAKAQESTWLALSDVEREWLLAQEVVAQQEVFF